MKYNTITSTDGSVCSYKRCSRVEDINVDHFCIRTTCRGIKCDQGYIICTRCTVGMSWENGGSSIPISKQPGLSGCTYGGIVIKLNHKRRITIINRCK